MTGQEVRDLGYLAWRDPLAWMETMKGKRWTNLIEKERAHYHTLTRQPAVQRMTHQMEHELAAAQSYLVLDGYTIGGGAIDVILTGRDAMYWKWSWSTKKTIMDDVEVQGTVVWYVTKSKDDAYDNHLLCEDAEGKRLWKKSDISSQVAVILPYCYYVRTMDYFNAIEVCVCDAYTGRNERVLYREKDDEKDLILYKTNNRTLYFKSDDPNGSRLFEITGQTVKPLFLHSTFQWPLGKGIDGKDCVFTKQNLGDPWTAHGTPLDKWTLPSEEMEWVNLSLGLVITMAEGAQTIWYCAPHHKPQPVFRIRVGSIEPDAWASWEQSIHQRFVVKSPFQLPYLIDITHNRVSRVENRYRIRTPLTLAPLEAHRFHALSADQTSIPYVTVLEKGCRPRAAFIYVYGAYGSSTPVMWPYQTWLPLLKRGWVIVYAMVRGGGDKDAAWADAARRENRHRAIDDYEAVIRATQARYHLGPDKTVLYGRSAGGVPVGAMVSRYPKGDLMGAVFTEAPYVDVLRTTTNPSLPLTKGEYKEFGNPKVNILDMKELLSVSPVNTLPPDGAPGVFVVTHVGLLDRQVLAYESVKWIQMLRGETESPAGKYVTFERNEAHQYTPKKMPHFRATDLAVIQEWMEGTLLRKK